MKHNYINSESQLDNSIFIIFFLILMVNILFHSDMIIKKNQYYRLNSFD